jgi:hypothetical protein
MRRSGFLLALLALPLAAFLWLAPGCSKEKKSDGPTFDKAAAAKCAESAKDSSEACQKCCQGAMGSYSHSNVQGMKACECSAE